MQSCPNFGVCGKMMRPGLKVCTSCFWKFRNEPLQFKNSQCPNCRMQRECVKFRKCEHFLCTSCFSRQRVCLICEGKK